MRKNFKKQHTLRLYGFTASQRGVALLPMVLVLFLLVMVVGVGIATISFSEGFIAATKDASDKAMVIADSGVQDALGKVIRDKSFVSAGYSLSVSGGTATITVAGSVPGTKTIISSGTLNGRTRKIQAAVSVDANGKVTYGSNWWQEVAP